MEQCTATIELTDMFGGEANYDFAKRATIDSTGLTDRQVTSRLKAKVGLRGTRATLMYDTGDMRQYRVIGGCFTFFITTEY